MTDDEKDVWQQVAQTVKPLRKKSAIIAPNKITKAAVTKPVSLRADITPPRIGAETLYPASPLPSKRVRQLKRQQIPIEGRLDLHGYTVRDAHEVLNAYMAQAQARGWRCVEIITGRGDPLRGTGQLRRFVPLWLDMISGVSILHTEPNPASRGGSLLVLLRRNKQ